MQIDTVNLMMWPVRYRRLTSHGEWRLTVDWLSRAPARFARRVDHFPEGAVYRFWCAWLFVKVMVKT